MAPIRRILAVALALVHGVCCTTSTGTPTSAALPAFTTAVDGFPEPVFQTLSPSSLIVEVLFPRANATYDLTGEFPLVLGIKNLQAASSSKTLELWVGIEPLSDVVDNFNFDRNGRTYESPSVYLDAESLRDKTNSNLIQLNEEDDYWVLINTSNTTLTDSGGDYWDLSRFPVGESTPLALVVLYSFYPCLNDTGSAVIPFNVVRQPQRQASTKVLQPQDLPGIAGQCAPVVMMGEYNSTDPYCARVPGDAHLVDCASTLNDRQVSTMSAKASSMAATATGGPPAASPSASISTSTRSNVALPTAIPRAALGSCLLVACAMAVHS